MGVGGERPVLRPTRRVELEPISRDGWAPFGWIPVADTDPDDGNDRLEFDWADPHVNLIGHRRDEVPIVDAGLRCEEMFRHRTHTQVLMVLDVPAVIAVAPASVDPTTAAGSEAVRAFSLPVSSSLVLHRGTWHWGPYPAHDEEVRLFNVQGLRYAEDNDRADLAGSGLAVDVLIP